MPSPGLLQRLKERKLGQWGLAYLAGAWVAYEATGTAVEVWDIPLVLVRAVHVLLLVGFFLVLVVAWYHGEKGRQRASGLELLIVTVLLGVAGIWLWTLGEGEGTPVSVGPGAEEDGVPALTVLPFDDNSPDPNDAYFADGMHEELIATLTNVSGLTVKGRTSVIRYREDPKPLRGVAEDLGVSYVMEGNARIAGDLVSVTVQLIDARTDEHLWAQEYDRPFSRLDVISVHRDIAEHVASALSAVLTDSGRARISAGMTDNSSAYRQYLRGRFKLRERTPDGFLAAIDHFNRATSIDPGFSAAYAAVADAYSTVGLVSDEPDFRTAMSLGQRAAEQAVAYGPDLPQAHAALGVYQWFRRDWAEAEREFRRAVELDRSYSDGHNWLAVLLSNEGRHEEAIAFEWTALRLDPLSLQYNLSMGYRLFWARRHEEAAQQLEQTLDLYPQHWPAWMSLAFVLFAANQPGEGELALAEGTRLLRLSADTEEELRDAIASYRETGVEGRLPAEVGSLSLIPNFYRIRLSVLVGDLDGALDLLEASHREGGPECLSITADPMFDPLRDRPRFKSLVEEYSPNLAPAASARG